MAGELIQPGPAPAPAPAPPQGLRRYWQIYVMLWRNSVVREMGFKSNFLLWIVVELLWFGLQLSFMTVLYQHTNRIGDWSQFQVVLLVGTSQLIQQLFTALFLNNCVQISEHVRTGRMDFFLLLPVNTRFLLSFRQVDLGAFVNAASALLVICYAGRQLHLVLSVAQVAGFILLCSAGVLVHYSLMFLLTSVSFWTVKAQGIVWGYYNLFNIARLPDVVFRGSFRVVFTFILPMLLVANVPAKLLVQKLSSPFDMLLLLAMSLGCLIASEVAWRGSVRRYTSASS